MNAPSHLLNLTVLSSGLLAGLYVAWSISVLPGLNRLDDARYLETFQSLNRAILNPAFKALFVGTAIVAVAAVCAHALQGTLRWPVVAAAALLVVGHIGVTAFGNIPLNVALDSIDVSNCTAPQLTAHRAAFQQPWAVWHAIRTVAATVAFGCLVAS